ncbi:microfibril-associated glycoprotein 4-like [Alosa sapidissima]|uniref:microfibril-associated glycoprotein 4-like n=1 Tax=Alosa sapidissima TaxID=34773 RepID=UPI001C0862A3|nr:microfibril-associated glycoprotein 4-like [Alosa sapidissima]XP_041958876.1 microfibril-associated glycoprotein 4-like [Alosa sapidissima]
MMIQCAVLLLLPLLGQCALVCSPTDCAELWRSCSSISGVQTIYPNGADSAVTVYCDMGCENDTKGGWTVFQRRLDGTVTFFRSWEEYKKGFGFACGEYWLGLDFLHQLTRNKAYELRVDMEDFEGNRAFARYSSFSVASEEEGYKLTVSGFTNGGAGDSLSYHNGQKFSTFDKDHKDCANTYLGGHWYNGCHYSNPNGIYAHGPTKLFAIGVNWLSFKGHYYSLKSFTMKIRPLA